ncbi:L,D-transpeptidase family protein [uncultured Pontibacter sp.]|uniref:L,D-transpeptidase family protein n=1 Tax=uncultured Pontibacter sp. TaxID=453356 RepID=UPI002611FB8D|nr:L,D-transpeptidase family protein [uncultured Pontibacter sp.]
MKDTYMHSTLQRLTLYLVLLFLPILATAQMLPQSSARHLTSDTPDTNIPRLDSSFVNEYISNEEEFRHHLQLVEQFYQDRDYKLAWFKGDKLVPQAEKLIQVLVKTHREGLDPSDYQVKDLQAMYRELQDMRSPDTRKQQEIDLALTASYFNYAADFYTGTVNPHKHSAIKWGIEKNKIKLHKALQTILQERESTYPYYEFEALHEGYQKLREVLVQYQQIQEQGGWPKVEEQGLVQLQDTAEVVLSLRKRLLPDQQIRTQDSAAYVYDEQLKEAVEAFQKRHGLLVDGVVGPQTYQALNVGIEERIDQLVLNMERWRWLPKRLEPEEGPQRYVMVNIPAFKVYVMEDGEEVMRMRAVVGKTMHSTPVFSHEIQYLVFAPYWNVPNSIVEADIKPKLLRNRNWLETQNMEMVTSFGSNARRVPVSRVDWANMTRHNFEYRIRQRPGPNNSLGRVKFMFPNEYSVYLHDTPANHLFDETDRDFSHGCVRVEKPTELATYLLQHNPGWDKSRVRSAMNGREEINVNLKQNVPVYLVYFTAWVEEDGTVHFRDDLYNHDKALAQQLF